MTILKKLIFILFLLFFISPVFSNECIEQIDDRKIGIALFFQNCRLQDKDIKTIVAYANNNPQIERLFLDHNYITDKGIEYLGSLNNTVKLIEMIDNKIQGKTLDSLRHLEINTLFINDNPIDSVGIKKLLSNKFITNLWISSDNLDDTIVSSGILNRRFDMLGIESNQISSDGWRQIAEFSNVTSLLVSGHKVDDGFAEKISQNIKIELLALKTNVISSRGFTAIFTNPSIAHLQTDELQETSAFLQPLSNSRYLKSLFVSPTKDVVLTAAIGDFFVKNTSLEMLYLYPDNKHRFVFNAGFADALSNTHLTDLIVVGYKLSDSAAIKLSKSHYLKYIAIVGSQIGNEGAIAFSNNPFIVDLDLSDNRISDQGALAFINNETLESLDLSNNPISQAAAENLIANSKIKNITIDQDDQLKATKIPMRKKHAILMVYPKYFFETVKGSH